MLSDVRGHNSVLFYKESKGNIMMVPLNTGIKSENKLIARGTQSLLAPWPGLNVY
jgi:hypothetical protein